MKQTAQLTKTLKDIANYVQIKYNSKMTRMIRDVERPIFTYPAWPVGYPVTSDYGKTTHEKVDKMDVYVWKKEFEKVLNKEAEFKEKKIRV